MIEYFSDDHEFLDWEIELRKVLGDKLLGTTIRTPNEVIEIRTTGELEPSEMNAIKSLTGKSWIKQK